jgi:ketosteroid isomerase-like protein
VQSAASIRRAAAELDEALEAADPDRVASCFAGDCSVELLGVRLRGPDGVRRWLSWVFEHLERLKLVPRMTTVDGATFVEEFTVTGVTADGRRLVSRWVEVLTYEEDLVTSLRLYFDPIDFAPTLGVAGRLLGPIAAKRARRGLEPFEALDDRA